MQHEVFATAITCLDGRAWFPVVEWFRSHYRVDHVNTITEQAPESILATGAAGGDRLRQHVLGSLRAGRVVVVGLAGHAGCDSNPAPPDAQQEQIRRGVATIAAWDVAVPVVGLWVDAQGRVTPIAGARS